MAKSKSKNQPQPKSTASSSAGKETGKKTPIDFYTILLGLVVLMVAIIRFRLLSVPFERDEGEYAYIGNLILYGDMPYRDAYNMKLPGTYCMYSIIIALFGSTPVGIHSGLMIMSLATIIILYAAIKRLFTPVIALVCVTVYGLLAVSSPMLGFAAHATHFINLFFSLGLFFYSRFTENKRWLYAGFTGLMFGLAFLMKQQAALLVVFGGVIMIATFLFDRPLKWKNLILNTLTYSVAAVIPYLLVVLVMLQTGVFKKFWFWTFTYAGSYASSLSKWEDIKIMFGFSFERIFYDYPVMWLLAIAGFILVWFGKQTLFQKLFVTLMALFSFAAVCPGFYFREHYFILFLPAVGLLVAIGLDFSIKLISGKRDNLFLKILPFVVVLIIGLAKIGTEKGYYMDDDKNLICKKAYGSNPFVEAPEIGKFIQANSDEADKIGVLGSEPEIFVYAGRKSASGYIYVYGFMEDHKYNKQMQNEMIAELEKNKPKFMVYCNINTSWLARPTSPMDILNWLNKYLPENYDRVGMVDIPSDGGPASYYWGAEAMRNPQYPNYIHILKRKNT